jgi:type I restriction enzyme, S subunit
VEILEEAKERNQDSQTPIWSITNDKGLVDESEEHSERIASANISNYKLVFPNDFAYNPAWIHVGSLALNESKKIGCVSPSYIVFRIKDPTINPKYLYCLFNSSMVKEQIKNFAYDKTRRKSLSFENLGKISVPIILSYEKQQEAIKEWEEDKKEIDRQKQSVKYFQEKQQKLLNNLW